MASVISSIKNITGDPWWAVKIGIFTGVYFFLRNQRHIYNAVLDEQTTRIFELILLVIFMGIGSVSMHRNINNKSPFFPGLFNIFDVLIKSVFSAIVMAPGIFLGYAVYTFLNKSFTFEPIVTAIVYIIAAAIVSPFIFIPVVLMSVRGNIFDALRLNNLFAGAGNFIVQMFSYIIQHLIIVCSLTICLYFFLVEMLGDHPALLILQCFIIVLTFFSFLSYCSDLYGEAIPEIKFSEDTKKPRNLQKKKKKEAELAAKHEEKMHGKHVKKTGVKTKSKPGAHPVKKPVPKPKPPENG